MKKHAFLLIALLNSLLVFGNESISVGILNGPSCIPTGYMMENVSNVDGAKLSFEKFADPKALLPKLLKKEVDIGFLPVNVAAKVFNTSNGAIKIAAITGNGNIALVTKDPSIEDLEDLENKKVTVAGQGATPDYLFRYLLTENGVEIRKDGDDYGVELDFSIPTPQIAPSLLSNKITYAVVPEPFITVMQIKDKDIRVPIDFQEEYKEATGGVDDYPLTVMVVTKDFAENNADLLEEFLEEYEKSFKWTIKNPSKAGELSEKHNLGFQKPIATKAIPKSNYCFIEADEGQDAIEGLLDLFLNFAPEAIGGKLPTDDFYFVGD